MDSDDQQSTQVAELLADGESNTLDYKRLPGAIKCENLIAFANSELGGTFLVGVDEKNKISGQQYGEVVGCDASDSSIQSIQGRALACIPPVAISIEVIELSIDEHFARRCSF